ncbi:MAG: hypothetical protein ACI9LD_001854 [Polaromonas sp.]|jgi:hypothetical protein
MRLLFIGLVAGLLCTAASAQVTPELAFKDFFNHPMGSKGLEMSAKLNSANGQRVQITGYMVQQEVPHTGRFMLSPRPVQMSEHADGEADDLPAALVTVYLDDAQKDWLIPYKRGLMTLSGQLSVGRLEERDGRVSWVRLVLPAQATRGMDSAELTNYLQAQQHAH